MKHGRFRKIIIFILMAGIIISCNAPLWGEYATPTAELPAFLQTDLPATNVVETPISATTVTPVPLPTVIPTLTPTPRPINWNEPPILYYSQSGDWLSAVAARFGVDPSEITSPNTLPSIGLLDPGTLLIIPKRLDITTPQDLILPDSDFIFSSSAIDFNVVDYVNNAGGYLSTYREYLASTAWTSGAQVVNRIAIENSINPRLLLALLEFESKWVTGQPINLARTDYPFGKIDILQKGLYKQYSWAVKELSKGYYGWRSGTLTELTFPDGSKVRLSPHLNAGSVAIQYFFSRRHNQIEWALAIDPNVGFPALYREMYGDPWLRAQTVEPLFPINLAQPALSLPFLRGQVWSFTGGPHPAWEIEGPISALDFAPASVENGCAKSDHWIVAPAAGLVVRSGNGVVVLDLDGDGYEQTGWVLLFLHVASEGRAPKGRFLDKDGLIGLPSCEGGISTGTHVHIARKYNGEWVLTGSPLPFELSGWVAYDGAAPYKGTLIRDEKLIEACVCGSFETRIVRGPND